MPPVKKSALSQVSAVESYLTSLKTSLGKEIAYVYDEELKFEVPHISTGIPALDLALGCGGIPKGRIIEVFGPEMSGKTTLALQIIAQAQKEEGVLAHFIDAEHALDLQYAQNLGVDLSRIIISQPDNGEQALSVVEFAAEKSLGVVVVDSVAALVPKAEIEGEMGDAQMGLQARLMSQAMRKLTGIASKNSTTIIFINQIRMKIGGYGNPEVTSGGNALKFYASVRIDIRKGKPIKESSVGDDELGEDNNKKARVLGQETNVKIVKNKCAAPFRFCSFDLIYGKGFNGLRSLISVAVERGIIDKGGAWYSYNGEKWQGMAAVEAVLQSNPALLETLEKVVFPNEATS